MSLKSKLFPGLKESERLARLRLARSENIGPRSFRSLVRLYGSAARALNQVDDLARAGGKSKPVVVMSEAAAKEELEKLEALSAQLLVWGDEAYPPLLAGIEDAPPVLSVRGNVALLSKESVALVGARHASAAGVRFAYGLAEELARDGVTVVSGLARGIDTAAHKGALTALPEGASTVAVLAGGVDHIYPPENEKLYHEIIKNGAVISEMPLGAAPKAQHFPRRNRIISGLSKATVVIEASVKSGSLITARFALEQGREVGAVPGSPLDGRSEGPNKLLKQGAFLVERAEDILEAIRTYASLPKGELPLFEEPEAGEYETEGLDDLREQVRRLLSLSPISIDELVEQCDASAASVQVVLLEMELAGVLTRHPGGAVSLAP